LDSVDPSHLEKSLVTSPGLLLTATKSKPETLLTTPISLCFSGFSLSSHAMLDSGASASFMDHSFALQNNIPLVQKAKPLVLEVIDGSEATFGPILYETEPISLQIGSHLENLSFDIIVSPHYLSCFTLNSAKLPVLRNQLPVLRNLLNLSLFLPAIWT